jgi:hypothetical protein
MIFSFFTYREQSSSIQIQSINRFTMKKKNYLIFALLLCSALLSTGCDKIPDEVVDVQSVDYKLQAIVAPTSMVYTSSDSVEVTSIQIANTGSVGNVWCKVSSVDGTVTVAEQIFMYDDGVTSLSGDAVKGDGIYSCRFWMSKLNPNGKYEITYYVEDNVNQSSENLMKVGSQLFTYYNGQNNLAPVISNLVLPSSINRGVTFAFSVDVVDPNGSMDIQSVYYRLYNPSGTLMTNTGGLSNFPMFDAGETASTGDQTEGDGTYSVLLKFPLEQPAGEWKFVFQAKDRNGKTSNEITQTITVN